MKEQTDQPTDEGAHDPAPGADHRAAEGVDHLQAAASELIAAARSFLDVVEEVVRDKDAVASVVDTLGSVAHAAGQAASKVAAARERGAAPPADDGDGDSPRVQHIRVS